jgi:transcriptional regulator with XRE-family HTH domain
MKSISETVRAAMIATGLNDWEVSRQVAVSQPQLWQFRNGTSNPKASTIDALAAWLGLELVPAKRPASKKASGRGGVTPRRSSPQPRKRGASHEPKG